MINKFLYSVTCLMILSLVLAACAPAATTTAPTTTTAPSTPTTPITTTTPATPTTPTGEKPQQDAVKPGGDAPKYGGTLMLGMANDVTTWDPARVVTGSIHDLVSEQMFEGDWAKGQAGGYGTKQTKWAYANADIFDLKVGFAGQSAKWSFDAAKGDGTIVYQVRQGVRFGLDPTNEASRLVNGREMTADDVVYSLKRNTTWERGYVYLNQIELRTANITKTGPWEVTVKVPYSALIMAVLRYNDTARIVPHEVVEKYGDMEAWSRIVGTGSFMLNEYVSGSMARMKRNANYYQKDPVGPGKGNQLPYLDEVNFLILPDASTRYAAMRTGKIDQMSSLTSDNYKEIVKYAPQLLHDSSTSFQGRGNPPLNMRIDTPPFNDIRVRRAMLMSIDYNAILQGYFGGEGQIYTWPHSKIKEYEELYLDPADYSESAKELYSYNPEKAKQLLKEAGYPNGFKTNIILISTEVDFISIYKDYLSKIGIDMALDIKDLGIKTNIQVAKTHTQMITGDTAPIAIFYNGQPISGTSHNNRSMVDDPKINAELIKIREVALTDIHQAMKMYRELTKYVVEQAYAIPAVVGTNHTLWWPWLRSYSGELNLGYDNPIWPTYIWYDQNMKKSMGK